MTACKEQSSGFWFMAAIFSSAAFVHPLQQEAEHCESDRELWENFWEAVSGKIGLHQLISLLLSVRRPKSQRKKPQHLLATDHLLCKAAGQSFAVSFSVVWLEILSSDAEVILQSQWSVIKFSSCF